MRQMYLAISDFDIKTRVIRVSNDTHGSNVLSSFEEAKGYTLPIYQLLMQSSVDLELIEALANILARRKLDLIMR